MHVVFVIDTENYDDDDDMYSTIDTLTTEIVKRECYSCTSVRFAEGRDIISFIIWR